MYSLSKHLASQHLSVMLLVLWLWYYHHVIIGSSSFSGG